MFLVSLLILEFSSFIFLHNPSFTFANNIPTPYTCFPLDTIPVQYHCFHHNVAGLNPNPNPVFSLPRTSLYSPPKPRKWLLAFSRGNAIATVVIIVITLLDVIVYKLRQLQETNSGEKLTASTSLPSGQLCRRFSLAEILSATHNFDESLVIGSGGFGKVYKGIIDNEGSTVAIKRLNSTSKQGAAEFWTEIAMLSKYRHSHLVSLLGYCDNYYEMILVYEYMVNGTLADHLYKIVRNGGSDSPLTWVQRLKICIGAARGLDYLHTGTGIQHRVIHRDVKSTNILLDENWAAKISDFGMSKVGPANQPCTHVSTHVKGTFGYVDPEYFLTRRLTRKSDVYSFGVVLLEVLCGRPSVDSGLHEDQRGLARWAQHCIKEGNVERIVDPNIRGIILSNCLSAFVQIADQCLDILPKKRPTMAEVVAWLEFALSLQERRDSMIYDEEIFNGVHNSQEHPESSSNREIIIDDNGENHGEKIDETEVLGDAKYGQSSPACLDDSSGGQFNIKEAKRLTVRKKVQLFISNRSRIILEKVRGIENCWWKSDDLPSTNIPSGQGHGGGGLELLRDTKSNNNNGVKDGSVVQLVPPSRQIATPKPVHRNEKSSKTKKDDKDNSEKSALPGSSLLTGQILTPNFKKFTFAELKIATRGFGADMVLGKGGFGRVFIGWVNEKTYSPSKHGIGLAVAVKRFSREGLMGFKEWQAEVELLGRVSHPNLVKLVGYCLEVKDSFLVYEYMNNGSLEKHLFKRGEEPLSWETRLRIAIGAARGLSFLHTNKPAMIHRDVKPSNILLDRDFNAKLSDFGLVRLAPQGDETHVSTRIIGTFGHLAPEYIYTGNLFFPMYW
ncbi:hypothetical protein LguiA_001595 [Lonicera macranthoides]